MPSDKRAVEEAIAKAKSRQAKVRKLMHGADIELAEPPRHEPQHDVVSM